MEVRNGEQIIGIYNQALAAEKRGRVAEALRLYKRALRQDLNFRPALIALGALYSRIGNPTAACRFFERAYDLKKDDTICFNLGSVAYQLNRFAESRSYLKECLRFNRRLLRAHILLAYIYQGERRWNKAAIYYRNALFLDRRNRMALLGYCLVLSEQGNYRAALQFLERHCREFPGDQGALSLKAALLLQLGQLDESYGEYQKLIDQSKRFTSFTSHLEEARKETGHEYLRLFENLDLKIMERTRRLQQRLSAKGGRDANSSTRTALSAVSSVSELSTAAGPAAKSLPEESRSNSKKEASKRSEERLRSELQDMIDISLLHLFNGDRNKALEYLFQAHKHKRGQ